MHNHYHITNAEDYMRYLSTIKLSGNLHSGGFVMKDEKHQITEEEIDIVPVEEISEEIRENVEGFNIFLNQLLKFKLKYLVAEGFMREESDRFVFYTDQELEQNLKDIENSVD